MLKWLALLCVVVCACSADRMSGKTADMDFLHKQKKIYELLLFVNQYNLMDAEFYDAGRNFEIENNVDMFTDKNVVQEFLYYYKQGMLKKDAIFSPNSYEQVQEVKLLFKLFYGAKDFQTFYKTASWARIYLNDGVFTTAFTVAVFNRPDCKYMRLPAIYEIYPNLFFDSNVIQEAHRIKMTRGITMKSAGMENIDSYLIYANYSGNYAKYYHDEEYKLDYFFEDFGLNSFYYYFRNVLPNWLNSKAYNIPKEIRGDIYYYIHQQLIARYNLERMSNGLFEIEEFDWRKPFYPGYYSTLYYQNGIAMPQRNRYSNVPYYNYKYLKEVDILEYRIMNAIDTGFVFDINGKQVNIYTPEGLNILGNIIEGNADTCNFRYYGMYDVLARDILGYNANIKNKNLFVPSALQCYSTCMRDPAFYRIYNRIMQYFYRYKKNLPKYTQNELSFGGVKIETVNVDKLITYFDYCDTLINNAVYYENFKEATSLRMKARRYCLNYKPFNYRFNVNSDKDTKATVRIFLGPHFDDVQQDYEYLNKYYMYFVELDKFVVNLRSGSNTIDRKSSDSSLTMPDMMSGDLFYKKLQKSISGSEPFTYYEKLYGFPERLTLPKGTADGTKYKLFFYVSPLDESKVYQYELPIFGKLWYDGKAFGFPLDRPIYGYKNYGNMFFKDVYIYHTKEEKTY